MNLEYYALQFLAGGAGQVVRVCYGLKNAIDKNKDISVPRLLTTLLGAMIAGGLIGIWTQDPRAAFFGGLAATDIVEGMLKASHVTS